MLTNTPGGQLAELELRQRFSTTLGNHGHQFAELSRPQPRERDNRSE